MAASQSSWIIKYTEFLYVDYFIGKWLQQFEQASKKTGCLKPAAYNRSCAGDRTDIL